MHHVKGVEAAIPNPPNCIQYLDDPPYGALSSLLRSVNVSVLNEESPGNLNPSIHWFPLSTSFSLKYMVDPPVNCFSVAIAT